MKVLIVSDDAVFARLVTKKIESWGHQSVVALSGTEARERISREPFRVVITGADVPGLSGPELCRMIRGLKRARYTYVIIYEYSGPTASAPGAETDSMMAGLEAGADDYLTLPLNPLELRLKLKNAKRLLNLEDELREGPGIDRMTGVVNEAGFRQFFRAVLADARRNKRRGAIMHVHVGNYHDGIAEYGYDPVQSMMAEMAGVLTQSTRGCDFVARMSDDEFCLLLQDTFWDRCIPVAERIIKRSQHVSVAYGDRTLHPQLSIDTINFPVDDLSSDDILALPDGIAYAA